jgi:hypothetical protein
LGWFGVQWQVDNDSTNFFEKGGDIMDHPEAGENIISISFHKVKWDYFKATMDYLEILSHRAKQAEDMEAHQVKPVRLIGLNVSDSTGKYDAIFSGTFEVDAKSENAISVTKTLNELLHGKPKKK